jgi:hypothetical protein
MFVILETYFKKWQNKDSIVRFYIRRQCRETQTSRCPVISNERPIIAGRFVVLTSGRF